MRGPKEGGRRGGGGVGSERREGRERERKGGGCWRGPAAAGAPPADSWRAEEREGAPCTSASPGLVRIPPLACQVCLHGGWTEVPPRSRRSSGEPQVPRALAAFLPRPALPSSASPVSNPAFCRGVSAPESCPPNRWGPRKFSLPLGSPAPQPYQLGTIFLPVDLKGERIAYKTREIRYKLQSKGMR